METLTFYEYGYIISTDKDGKQDRYFYYQNNGSLDIYVSDSSDGAANAYGFVKMTLDSELTNTLTFGEKTYHKNTDGDSLSFAREGTNYPIKQGGVTYSLGKLIFDASDETEFEVNGLVELTVDGNTSKEKCVVQREVENGVEKTYVVLADYRFKVDLTFMGEDADGDRVSSYTIVDMETYQVAYAYNFLSTYAYYAGFGYQVENTLGEITIHGYFNEDGTAREILADATFLKDSTLKDEYGNLIKLKNATYEVHEEYRSATFTIENESAGEGLEKSYTYTLYFKMGPHKIGAYAYQVLALTRHQTFTYGGYDILTERVVGTEVTTYDKGDLFSVTVKKDGVDLGGSLVESEGAIQFVDCKALYVVRTKDGDKYTGATYYDVSLESAPIVDDGEGEASVPMYTAVSIAQQATVTKIVYDLNGKYFADFINDRIGVITLVRETLIGTATEEVAVADLHEMYKNKESGLVEDAHKAAAETVQIVKAYKVTTSKGVEFMVQIRTIEVDGETIEYLYAQEIYNA
jgi:hypothetical protein